MANWDFIIAPAEVKVDFKVSPAIILVNSLHLITFCEENDNGLHSWVIEVARSMTPEQSHTHHVIMGCLADTLIPKDSSTFPDFIAQLTSLNPEKIRDEAMAWMLKSEIFPGKDAVLANVETFVTFVRQHYELKKERHEFDEPLYRDIHPLLADPARLKQELIAYLQMMWDTHLAKEWKRSKPMLEESVAAYSKKDFSGLNAFEAVEAVTGRDMRPAENMAETLEKARRLLFIPSPHLGPYISWQPLNQDMECVILFGARLPKGAEATSPALNRTELLVWLNALADDTRLKMLEMLFEHEELCAQDFIDMLELSQSSASRHLRQLTASGFLRVRRRDVNKCYTLNRERVEDTMTVLGKFLHK